MSEIFGAKTFFQMKVSSQARELLSPDIRGVPIDCDKCKAKFSQKDTNNPIYNCPLNGWCCKMMGVDAMKVMNGNKICNVATPNKGVAIANGVSGHGECLRWYPGIKAK